MGTLKLAIIVAFIVNGFYIGQKFSPESKTVTKYVTEIREVPLTKISLSANNTVYSGLLYSNAENVNVKLTVNEKKVVKDTTIFETKVSKYPYEWVRKLEMPTIQPVVLAQRNENVDLCYTEVDE